MKQAKLTYAYVSLFGVNSVTEIRRRLCLAALTSSGSGLLKWVSRASHALPEKASIQGIDVDLGRVGSIASDLIEERSLNGLFVCFDDLERAGANLQVHDLLGLLSELTESRDCRCLMLFNREKLSEPAQTALAMQDEKAFDLAVEYKPSPIENASIGFVDLEDRKHAAPVFEAFKNANIRIMKRVCWMLRQIKASGAENMTLLWPDLVKHAAVLCILRYAYTSIDITDAIRQPGLGQLPYVSEAKTSEATKLPEEAQGALKRLNIFEDTFDGPLIELLDTGALNCARFAEAVKEAYGNEVQFRKKSAGEHLVHLLHGGFRVKAAEYLPKLKAYLKQDLRGVNRPLVTTLCDILVGIEDSEENRSIVRSVTEPFFQAVPIAERVEAMRAFPALAKLDIHRQIPYVPVTRRVPITQIVAAIAEEPAGWDPEKYTDLAVFTDDEIREALLSQNDRGAIFRCQRLLERLDAHVPKELQANLRPRLQQIFRNIASMDPMYRYQIESYVDPGHYKRR